MKALSVFPILLTAFLGGGVLLFGQSPSIGDPPELTRDVTRAPASVRALSVSTWYDISTRTTARDNWHLIMRPTVFVPIGWTGSVAANIPGTTTQAFKDAVATRLNWFRAMAGVPAAITLDPIYSAKDQQAALMFSANRNISHTPPASWVDYSVQGAEAAANSNICYGYSDDPGCVVAYIIDYGPGNYFVGHRRWILYPQTQKMGTGDVPQSGPAPNPYPPANALWVFDGNYGTIRPATRDTYVAWPPAGFVPYQVVGRRWSFAYPAADFSTASVGMQRGGLAVPVHLEAVETNYGENTIVWAPDNLDPNMYSVPTPPASDTKYTVTITNVLIGGVANSFQYDVTVFNPDTPPPGATVSFTGPGQTVPAASAAGTADLVVTPAGTTWSVSNNVPSWLSLTPVSGSGSGPIGWSASGNTSSNLRSATISASGANFTVTQLGVPCVFTLSQSAVTLAPGGGSDSAVVTAAPSDCAPPGYTVIGPAVVNADYSTPGTVTISFSALANITGTALQTTVLIGGKTLTITQPSPFTPALSVAVTHTGSFARGQLNAQYSIVVTNLTGAGATSGTVTVTETVPTGMTLMSMSGTGWTCPSGGATCTRGDALAGGSTYPAIAAMVNVAANAGSPLSNAVSVSGGGSVGANDTDPTTILTVAAVGLRFVPIRPCRVTDTRDPAGAFGGPAITGGATRNFVIPSSACVVPANAQAYSMNVAVVPAGPLGYLTVWPADQSQPLASTLNSLDGRVKSNAAIVPAGTGGAVSVFASNTTHIILDINGYFVPATDPAALAFFPVAPCRVVDTRNAVAPLGGPTLSGGLVRTFPVRSSACSIPVSAQAYSFNITAVPSGALGFLTAWSAGQTQPVVASLNASTGTVTANAAIVPAGTGGDINIFASNPTHMVIDINGYFAPIAPGGLSLYNVDPCRVLDTRLPAGTAAFAGLRNVPISGGSCNLPVAAAYVLSATAVPQGTLGFITFWSQGAAQPTVATLNALDAAVTSNLAIVPAASGNLSAFASNATHLILDAFGYFAP